VRQQVGVPVLTDVHTETTWLPLPPSSMCCRPPPFCAGRPISSRPVPHSGKPVNIKKGQFLAPGDMKHVVAKAREANGGADSIMVCERGASFGYNNWFPTCAALAIMRETGCPVVFDATHSVQLPGGQGTSSGGQREFVPVLARAAVAVGVSGLFMETHPDPAKACRTAPMPGRWIRCKICWKQLKAIDTW
jgi:2-dehydro-3-deoxyphosphooctonate aldolase (KDO 8-P synthase)